MILVILGTQDKPFNRLLEAVDKAYQKKIIKDKVIVQAGTTKYDSENMEIFDLIPMNKFNNLVGKADLIITHGGVGSIIQGLKKGKKIVAVPRLKKYGEHTNDHQLQIIDEFSKQGYIIPCKDINNLEDVLKEVKNFKTKNYKSNNTKMLNIITNFID